MRHGDICSKVIHCQRLCGLRVCGIISNIACSPHIYLLEVDPKRGHQIWCGKHFHPFRWNGSNSDQSCWGRHASEWRPCRRPSSGDPESRIRDLGNDIKRERERGSSTPRSDVEEEERGLRPSVRPPPHVTSQGLFRPSAHVDDRRTDWRRRLLRALLLHCAPAMHASPCLSLTLCTCPWESLMQNEHHVFGGA